MFVVKKFTHSKKVSATPIPTNSQTKQKLASSGWDSKMHINSKLTRVSPCECTYRPPRVAQSQKARCRNFNLSACFAFVVTFVHTQETGEKSQLSDSAAARELHIRCIWFLLVDKVEKPHTDM